MESTETQARLNGKKLFVGGDLSGIQKFIYNISSRRAAVSLKGRSTYLTQFTSELCRGIQSLDNITGYDEVYCSGGKFYVIIDNTSDARASLDYYYKCMEKKIWEEHKGQLGLGISYVAFTQEANGILVAGKHYDKVGELWRILSENFTKLKVRKFNNVILENFSGFFDVTPVNTKHQVCAITGIESSNLEPIDSCDEDSEKIYVLPTVKKQIDLGVKLRNEEGFKTFEQYADGTYLGVLRMDVDGLGKRFIKGFDSIEEYRSFSNKLLKFFEDRNSKYIKGLQKSDKYLNYLSIVYAGGDDIFVVGKWNKVIEFAEDINVSFTKYLHDESMNADPEIPELSISGGVAIVHSKFPIAKAAELAGEAEDSAKEHVYIGESKNAFCMFGEALSWKYEFCVVKEYKKQLYNLISRTENAMSRGFLHKIMNYALIIKSNEQKEKEGKKQDYRYIWHYSYNIKRMMDRYKDNDDVRMFLEKLKDENLEKDKDKMKLLAVAARWAELELRETKK